MDRCCRCLFAIMLLLGAGHALALVDLNTATSDMLEELDGIGPARAQAIIEYRQQHGPFQSLDQLLEVKGIGPSILGRIKSQAVLGGDRPQPPPKPAVKKSPEHPGGGPRYFGDTPPH